MRRLLVLCFLLVAAPAWAQEGRVVFKRSVQFDFELPERIPEQMRSRIPTQRVDDLVLLFNASESVMVPAPEPEAEDGAPTRELARRAEIGLRMRMFSASRSDQEQLLRSHVTFADGTVTETREFVGRTFLISGPRPEYRWSLSGEQREFLGYVVQKATAVHEDHTIEAWFTMEIPVPAGPASYGGLPGLILLVSVDEGHTFYAATDVDLSGLGDAAIAPPDEGDRVSREEYEEIVADKLEEIESLRRGRERRRPFP
jgi:GLPGLI family protein